MNPLQELRSVVFLCEVVHSWLPLPPFCVSVFMALSAATHMQGTHMEIREQPHVSVLTFHFLLDTHGLLFTVAYVRLIGPLVLGNSVHFPSALRGTLGL